MRAYHTAGGSTAKLGASITPEGIHFCLFSHRATGVTLHLFATATDLQPSRSFVLKEDLHRSGDRWHIYIQGCRPGQLYLYTVDGPSEPAARLRFNPQQYLQDPYAKALTPQRPGQLPKCIAYGDAFDWEDDRPLNYPLSDCIIYEGHVKGLTQNCPYPSAGSYLGLIEHIPYLQQLGITSLELLPIMNFSYFDYSERRNPETGVPLSNYWGYNTANFFAPANHYAHSSAEGAAVDECKRMVKAMHRAGIEVILDVVFNHSSEYDHTGATLSFRGIDNPAYYILQGEQGDYANFTGCGNTLNCNHPAVQELIIDCLHYWVEEMHTDGFRFDLAAVLRRSQSGELLGAACSLVQRLGQDRILAQTKLIAEPWDASGTPEGYLLGSFAHNPQAAAPQKMSPKRSQESRWAEWNDRYRDDVRRFWACGQGVSQLATRFAGSSDIFCHAQQRPYQSINFVSCHDGFTLRDLFSYAHKHNWSNGEDNNDGHNHNFNRNYGVEGPTTGDIAVLRCRMVKNHLALLLLSTGTPMLCAGDELGNSQRGNNNAYCQDNHISWLAYDSAGDSELPHYQSLLRFVQQLIALRKRYAIFCRQRFWQHGEIGWYALKQNELCKLRSSEQWQAQQGNLVLLLDDCDQASPRFCCIFNAGRQALRFPLVQLPQQRSWQAVIDTHLPAPNDICLPPAGTGESRGIAVPYYWVGAQSVVVLMGGFYGKEMQAE